MKVFVRLFLALITALAMTGSAYAFEAPVLKAHVNDYANLLTPEQANALEGTLRAFEEKTTAQVVVLTTTSMQGLGIDNFSLNVFKAWKLGQKGKDNGLLITYSTDGDHYRIEVGYGLEGAIPDGIAGNIIRQQLRGKADPKHGTRDFYGAFTDAVQRVSGIIMTEYAKDPSGASMRRADNSALIIALVIALVVVIIGGIVHPAAGGVLGGFGGLTVGFVGSVSIGGIIAMVLIGIVIGVVIRPLIEAGGSPGGGSSGGWGDGGGGFSGGGGDCGGGGASD